MLCEIIVVSCPRKFNCAKKFRTAPERTRAGTRTEQTVFNSPQIAETCENASKHENKSLRGRIGSRDSESSPARISIMRFAVTAFLISGYFLSSPLAGVGAEPAKEQLDFFEKKIRPVLVKHCYECHSADSKEIKGGLLLDTRDGLAERRGIRRAWRRSRRTRESVLDGSLAVRILRDAAQATTARKRNRRL